VPLLGLVFIAEIAGAANFDWPVLANIAAIAGALGVLLLGIATVNRYRGRPARSIPEDVGRIELAAFVLIPALLPLIFNGQWRSALVTAAANIALLGLVYGVVGYGLTSIVRWVLVRLAGQLAASLLLMARAVPLIMVFGLLAFFNTEMWQVFSDVSEAGLAIIAGLFVVLGATFLIARLPREVAAMEDDEAGGRPLDRRQRLNVGLVLFVSQAMQVLAVTVLIAAFFIVLGAIGVSEEVRTSWIGGSGNELFAFDLFSERIEVTEELLRVAGGLAAFSGLYFAISMLTDSTFRAEFLDELTAEMRASFRARSEYLSLPEEYPGRDGGNAR
jgi:hypothetical protein